MQEHVDTYAPHEIATVIYTASVRIGLRWLKRLRCMSAYKSQSHSKIWSINGKIYFYSLMLSFSLQSTEIYTFLTECGTLEPEIARFRVRQKPRLRYSNLLQVTRNSTQLPNKGMDVTSYDESMDNKLLLVTTESCLKLQRFESLR